MKPTKARTVYINGCPVYECPICGDRFNTGSVFMTWQQCQKYADDHVRDCRDK